MSITRRSRQWPVSLHGMAEIDPFVTTIATHLGATSIRFERPKVKAGGIAPPLWILDLGVFRSWSGHRTWDLCFGKDQACLEDPEDVTQTICAEAIVARRLDRAGYAAGWLSAYRAPPPANWTPRMAFSSAQDVIRPAFPTIAASIGLGGTPDVFAHRGSSDLLFIEVKRDPDRLKVEQAAWFEAALAAGVPAARLLVAEWATEV